MKNKMAHLQTTYLGNNNLLIPKTTRIRYEKLNFFFLFFIFIPKLNYFRSQNKESQYWGSANLALISKG